MFLFLPVSVKVKVKVKPLSCVRLIATPWTVAYRLPCPWGFPGKGIGVGCHSLLQGIFPTQGSNLGLPHCRQTLYHLSQQGSPTSICGWLQWDKKGITAITPKILLVNPNFTYMYSGAKNWGLTDLPKDTFQYYSHKCLAEMKKVQHSAQFEIKYKSIQIQYKSIFIKWSDPSKTVHIISMILKK